MHNDDINTVQTCIIFKINKKEVKNENKSSWELNTKLPSVLKHPTFMVKSRSESPGS